MRNTILILAANPKDTPQLRLDQEVREIENGLERAQKREEFTVKQRWAARPVDVRRAMLDFSPNIVHFCGHGSGEEGIAFEDEMGEAKFVKADALAGFFKLFADRVECVVLNACFSEVQAKAISKYIPYVLGMSKTIPDISAIEFSVAFYDALGAGKTFEFAYELACNAIQWEYSIRSLMPILITKKVYERNKEELAQELKQEEGRIVREQANLKRRQEEERTAKEQAELKHKQEEEWKTKEQEKIKRKLEEVERIAKEQAELMRKNEEEVKHRRLVDRLERELAEQRTILQPIQNKDNNDTELWKQTQNHNTISSYKNYLEKYPNGKYADHALKQIELIKSELTPKTNFKKFIIPSAGILIIVLIIIWIIISNKTLDHSFKVANKINTIDAYKSFLSDYPESKYNEKSLYYIDSIEQNNLFNLCVTIEDFQTYLNEYPSGFYVDQANHRITFLKDSINRREIDRDGHLVLFINNTLLDERTGLIWSVKDNGYDINWFDAQIYCKEFRGGGYDDWRMPTFDELVMLYDKSKPAYDMECPGVSEIHTSKLIHLTCCGVWTITERRNEKAAFVHFNYGELWSWPKTGYNRVLPVRGERKP